MPYREALRMHRVVWCYFRIVSFWIVEILNPIFWAVRWHPRVSWSSPLTLLYLMNGRLFTHDPGWMFCLVRAIYYLLLNHDVKFYILRLSFFITHSPFSFVNRNRTLYYLIIYAWVHPLFWDLDCRRRFELRNIKLFRVVVGIT